MTAQVQWFADRDEWFRARSGGRTIGASDVPTILGVNPWETPLALWAKMTGRAEHEETLAMRIGKTLEPLARQMYEQQTGERLLYEAPFLLVRNDAYPRLHASPDFIWPVESDGRLFFRPVEFKFVSDRLAPHWEDGVPPYVEAQVQTQMLVCEASEARVAVILGTGKFFVLDVERDEAMQRRIVEAVEAFCGYIERDEEPPAEAKDGKLLQQLHGEEDAKPPVTLPVEVEEWTDRLDEIKAQIGALDAQKKELENRIKQMLGEASQGVTPNGIVWTWKTRTVAEHVVKAYTTRVLRVKRPKA